MGGSVACEGADGVEVGGATHEGGGLDGADAEVEWGVAGGGAKLAEEGVELSPEWGRFCLWEAG